MFTVWHIGFFRFLGGLVMVLIVFGRHHNPFRGHNTRLLIIRGCAESVAFISIVTGIKLLPISTALVIFYSFPAFSMVFAYLIYGERISKLQLTCIILVLIGVGVLLEFQVGGSFFGQAITLNAAVFVGLTVTLIRSLRVKNGPVIIYLYFCTIGALVTAPKFIMAPMLPATPLEWVMVLGIVFTSLTAHLLMNQGFLYCKGWEGGVLMSSEVIFTAMVGIVFLGDPVTLRFWVGGLLIFGNVVALNKLKAEHKGNRG
jgi:drug/metabolite transporter (DMT)-like permease